MSSRTRRAPFIVIEGLDRSGKTTQTASLHARLQSSGTQTSLLKFPDRTTAIGKMIDAYLRSASDLDDRAVHLLFSANRWELASTIEQTLLSGTPVICDRYAFSGIAFSAAKVAPAAPAPAAAAATAAVDVPPSTASPAPSPPAPHPQPTPLLPFEWCRAPDIGLPAPDLVLFFDITPEQARARGGYGEERYEKADMQARVRQQFLRIGDEMRAAGRGVGGAAAAAGSTAAAKTRWVVVDAGRERELVEEAVWELVGPLVKDGVEGPVGRLWTN